MRHLTQKSIFIFVIIIALFIFGFGTGLMITKKHFKDAAEEFRQEAVTLKNELQKAEYLNKKLKMAYQTANRRKTEIQQKEDEVSKKEDEIRRLTQSIAHAEDPRTISELKSQLENKNTELDRLREECEKLRAEVEKTRQSITETTEQLKDKNRAIQELTRKALDVAEKKKNQKGGEVDDELRKQALESMNLLRKREQASHEEAAGDSIPPFKREEKDLRYLNAYRIYYSINSKYDKERAYNKIKTQKIKDQISGEK